MLRSPLRWVGGKSRVRDKIIALFPPHSCYVEVFAGAAWVFFGKAAEMSKSEVLNDLDGELINFWRVVKHRSAEFAEAASRVLASRELFEEWRGGGDAEGEIERAVRFYLLIRLAFGAKRTRNHCAVRRDARPAIHWPVIAEEIGKIVDRLRQSWIEHLPWQRCLEAHDHPDTFFYLDPPYRSQASHSYAAAFGDEDHAALAGALRAVRGSWLLSCNDDAFIRGLYRWRGITVGQVMVRYRLQGGDGRRQNELLIRNF
jgi:DNA adenine methylase